MRHGFSFILVLFMVLFTVDDSLASILEQYILKDGREQCEEIKPYCPPMKPKKKKPRTPPPKIKAKKKCKRQYRLRPTKSSRCSFVKKPSCSRPSPKTGLVDQGVKGSKLQCMCKPSVLQTSSTDGSLLLKEITGGTTGTTTTTPTTTYGPNKCPKLITCPPIPRRNPSCKGEEKRECPKKLPKVPKVECPRELPKVTKIECPKVSKPPGIILKEKTINHPNKPCHDCTKKIVFKEDYISIPKSPKCIRCPQQLHKAKITPPPPTTIGMACCDNAKNLVTKKMTDTICPHFGHHDSNNGLIGLNNKKRMIGTGDNVVLEVKVPTLTQIARMGWNCVTFATDQCFNLVTKIQESREQKRHRIY